jgi:hypothetical protein
MQIAAASLVLAVIGGWGLSMGVMAVRQYQVESERWSMLEREADVATAESRVAAYRDDIGDVARGLEQRQKFLEEMTEMLPADAVSGETVSDSSEEAAKTVEKVSMSIPEAGALARIEARQLALVEKLTHFADQRAARAETAVRQLGLDPRSMIEATRVGQGGPLVRVSTEHDGSLDPRFARLGLSLARMDALERGLNGIPQFMPADIHMISSGFGFRADPFHGGAAMHTGLDFRGPLGSPIHAAADGGFRSWHQVRLRQGRRDQPRQRHADSLRPYVGLARPRRAGRRRGRRDRADRQHRPLDRPAPAFRGAHLRSRRQSAPVPGDRTPCSRRSPSRPPPAHRRAIRCGRWLMAARPSR